MKFVIIQERSRHPENIEFRESENIKRSLIKKGHEAIVWGLNYENFFIPFFEISKDADIIILLENYEINNWIPDLSELKKLKIFWSIDSHCVLSKHAQTVKKHKINIVLNSIESDMEYFTKTKNYYFPNAYPDDLIYPIDSIQKKYEVGFCGHFTNRYDWIQKLNNDFIFKQDIAVFGLDMVRAINSYKIHFNRNLANDVNYRTYETLGTNTLLITNETENLNKLFDVEKHFITYTDYEDLKDKIKFYISNPELIKEIALSGHIHVKNNHTYDKRIELLLQIINKNI
jgi:spore maturation protein CgeB